MPATIISMSNMTRTEKRRAVLLALLPVSLALTACSGSAAEAGRNDTGEARASTELKTPA